MGVLVEISGIDGDDDGDEDVDKDEFHKCLCQTGMQDPLKILMGRKGQPLLSVLLESVSYWWYENKNNVSKTPRSDLFRK